MLKLLTAHSNAWGTAGLAYTGCPLQEIRLLNQGLLDIVH